MLTRRRWMQTATAGAAALALPLSRVTAADPPALYTLPPLPYGFDALEPAIDAKTMEIHHDKHHKTYVDNLNKALLGVPGAGEKVETILRKLSSVPEKVRTAVRNNGGGHYNHSLFWTVLGPKAGGDPTGPLGDALKQAFGDLAGFKAKFKEAALGQFGSGWAWLAWADGKLAVVATPNQDSPLLTGGTPILGIDVWEHAYYLKYQNKRADYVDAFWSVVNWQACNERFAKAKA